MSCVVCDSPTKVFVSSGRTKKFCSDTCRKAWDNERGKAYYRENREARLDYQNKYNDAFWTRPLNNSAKAIVTLFEWCKTEEQKVKFADFLITQASKSSKYARRVNMWAVDDYVATYTTLAG
jgi:hypothetical protein